MPTIRNIAIIAHVDHGKTSLVDSLLKQSHGFKIKSDAVQELIMDANQLERERGITIFSKNAAVTYNGEKINIVDTPGHADFGGEVERIMRMVDGVLLVVDAKEGPMPQTRFVLKKAIQAGHKAIVVVNKIDKSDARPNWVIDRTFDLFVELGASDEQAEFPIIYGSAKFGKFGPDKELEHMVDAKPLFDAIVEHMPIAKASLTDPLQMLTVNLAYDNFKGKIAIGRLYAGTLKKGQEILHVQRDGKQKKARLVSVMTHDGMNRIDADEVYAGDIVAISGISDISIGETITDPLNPQPLPPIQIEEPTVKMTFGVNTSPFSGKEGQFTTSRNIADRLARQLETDVALKVKPTDSPDRFEVSGRGELHLSILIETMRREGFELQVSRPQVIMKEENGETLEPIEIASIEVPETSAGVVIEMMGVRRGELKEMKVENGTALLEFLVPTRGLIGFRNEFLTRTKGMGIINTLFSGFEQYKGDITSNAHGSLIAYETGKTNTYGLLNAQERGTLFVGPAVDVYAGQIVGQNAKPEDLEVNVNREKELSNMRSKGDGKSEILTVPRQLSLEDAIEYIGDDELVEVTPVSLRLRKAILSSVERKRSQGR